VSTVEESISLEVRRGHYAYAQVHAADYLAMLQGALARLGQQAQGP
jgi:hypothetical protein